MIIYYFKYSNEKEGKDADLMMAVCIYDVLATWCQTYAQRYQSLGHANSHW